MTTDREQTARPGMALLQVLHDIAIHNYELYLRAGWSAPSARFLLELG